jgi:prephenate dehydrogenase
MATDKRSRPILGVFGMGLVGGSVALGARERGLVSEVVAFDRDPTALETALARGAIDRAFTSLGSWVSEVDIGLLAVPVRSLPALAAALAPLARPNSVWCDVGSTKGDVLAALAPLLPNFVATHPMAGRETAGVQHAYAGLVENAIWAVCPDDATAPEALDRIETFIRNLGAFPVRLSATAHDRAVARISHVPWLVAVAMNRMLAEDADGDTLLGLAAGGFRDLTRVASGAPEMSRDMVSSNATEVRAAWLDLQRIMDRLAAKLEAPDALLDEAVAAKRTRDALPIVRRSLLPRVYDVVVELVDRPLELARLTTVLGEHGINIRDIEILKVRDGGEAIRVGVASDDDLQRARTTLAHAGYRCR